ncbi:MAG: SUMF1/EgtB/PvdO family nonheme iron enzyme [Nitrospinaceae bacterium]|nr:formylglycine-generating enzyme family protein [Nitrospinaceae bacterium]NIR56308.1 formylglycine-generating enzyme family protein [Nitrospinaceae bacterium]NIS86765.1 formylglycine-generating enzyme family protein [Nitrospinaceae bacterium]NIT83600.1 formylglycine-generating enzyme family protein [Nitrospinaceae bacterium]NIU45802.1 formylglycine-generating enzyme family protein [Nitrospinaceae bacterium]
MAIRVFNLVFLSIGFFFLADISPGWAGVAEKQGASEHDFSDMVEIPQGRFRIGLSFREVSKILEECQKVDKTCSRWWFKDEMPSYYVYLDAFWIDVYEVTNEKYLEFVKATGHRPALDDTCETDACRRGNLWKGRSFPEKIRHQPVNQVNWYDADAYCKWPGKRLPTEAEWEKAARGPVGNMYPWGNSAPPGRATFSRKWRGVHTMTDVGSYPTGISVYGVHDMAGNVWEWVDSWYGRNYYKKKIKSNPKGPKTGKFKVVRGGSWVNYADTLHSAFRRWSRPEVRFNDTGFRCAKDSIDETETN